MFRAVLLQVGGTLVVALVAGLVSGSRGALSAALGGAACFVPNFLFALRLSTLRSTSGSSYPAAFFFGEFIKIASTIGLLAIIATTYREVQWLALLAGLVVALKAPLLAFVFKS